MGIRIFCTEILNDSRSALSLLESKFSGVILYDGRRKAKDYRHAERWDRVGTVGIFP